jgi:hypothetical protein
MLLSDGSVTPLLGATVAVFVTVPVAAGRPCPSPCRSPTNEQQIEAIDNAPLPAGLAHSRYTSTTRRADGECIDDDDRAVVRRTRARRRWVRQRRAGDDGVRQQCLATDTSAMGARVSVSVAELSAGSGRLSPLRDRAVLDSVPVAAGSIVAVNVNVTVADPRARSSDRPRTCCRLTDTLGVGNTRPLGPDNDAGSTSTTRTPVAFDGPALVTMIVYEWPPWGVVVTHRPS